MGSVVAVPVTIAISLISARPSDIITFCKFIYAYSYIVFSRLFTKKRFDLYDPHSHDSVKLGFLPQPFEIEMESPQPESHLLHAADEVFIYGVNSSSETLVVRIARTVNHEAEAWIFMKLKDGKIYKLHKTSGYQNSCSDSGREFTCGGLRMHYIRPMRRWRIFFNGLLRETTEEQPTSNKLVHVKFSFLWIASSDVFDMTSDIDKTDLALAFAKSKWNSFSLPLEKLLRTLNLYAQAGEINGTLSVDGESTDRTLYLFGERMRFIGDTFLDNGAQFTHILGQVSKTGSIIHIAMASFPGIVKDLKFGFIVFPPGLLAPCTQMEIKNTAGVEEKEIKAIFHANGYEFKVKGNVAGKLSHFESNNSWNGHLTMACKNIKLQEYKASGVFINRAIPKPSFGNIPEVYDEKIPQDVPLVVHFSEKLCQVSDITGGKGSSLGTLTSLSKEHKNFIVPTGVVVTTSAYEIFLNDNIRREIRSLEDVLYGKTPGDVKESCQRVMDEVIKANIPDSILQAVDKRLQDAFGDNLHTKKFAVRSSATGEDTEQMSAAGQMETYLGVSGVSEIMSSVKKCWASQFGFVAVQYKRQNGQIVNCPMAVVIQEMISCDVAGVLFTCDPLTGNPTLMSITANYGLGESVVSGSEEPDTIELTRDDEDKLEIRNKIIGAKSHRIVIRDDAGTSVENVNENEKNVCCLSDVMALRLGNVAIQIEKKYRSNRDIEWGFWNNNLYIFQSRPVTSGTGETDYEIDHEEDGPMRIEKEYFSVCNVGEVMPGAMSPLGIDVLLKFFDIAMKRTDTEWPSRGSARYFPKGGTRMCYHVMFYVIDLLERINEGKSAVNAIIIGLFGRVLEDDDIYEIAIERYGLNKTDWKIKKYYNLIKAMFTAGSRLEKALDHYVNYRVPVQKMTISKGVFDTLSNVCDGNTVAMISHMAASQSSSIWNNVILSLIGEARGGICPETYRDFAELLMCINEVESAEVPSAMQSLAYHIGKEISSEEFKKMDAEEIVQWLNTSTTDAGIKFQGFLNRHGHRCLKEFDIRSTTWGQDPKLLIKLLQGKRKGLDIRILALQKVLRKLMYWNVSIQNTVTIVRYFLNLPKSILFHHLIAKTITFSTNLVGNVSEDSSVKKVKSFDEIVKKSGLKLKFPTRMLIKYFLLPHCRKAVQIRERSKSLMVKNHNEFRKGYRHLAKLMVHEGRIPDEDLMFFMTLEEIQELLKNRSPRIISRASHRRRRYPILDSYIYPEIMKGFPKPVNADDTPIEPTGDDFKMQGIPVSQGVAKGFVRVALNLEEASHLKPGEILLTYSTDIGWTPYFPSLAGVVTELGGLISHGAVVSREYGLPCIAGLHGATRQFKTGDYVLLDGNKGILQKILPPQ